MTRRCKDDRRRIKLICRYSTYPGIGAIWGVAGNGPPLVPENGDYEAVCFLPEGYRVIRNALGEGFMVDPAGDSCFFVTHPSGKPQLVSRAGRPVLRIDWQARSSGKPVLPKVFPDLPPSHPLYRKP